MTAAFGWLVKLCPTYGASGIRAYAVKAAGRLAEAVRVVRSRE